MLLLWNLAWATNKIKSCRFHITCKLRCQREAVRLTGREEKPRGVLVYGGGIRPTVSTVPHSRSSKLTQHAQADDRNDRRCFSAGGHAAFDWHRLSRSETASELKPTSSDDSLLLILSWLSNILAKTGGKSYKRSKVTEGWRHCHKRTCRTNQWIFTLVFCFYTSSLGVSLKCLIPAAAAGIKSFVLVQGREASGMLPSPWRWPWFWAVTFQSIIPLWATWATAWLTGPKNKTLTK